MEVPDHIVPPDCMEFRVSEMDPTQMGKWMLPWIYGKIHVMYKARLWENIYYKMYMKKKIFCGSRHVIHIIYLNWLNIYIVCI